MRKRKKQCAEVKKSVKLLGNFLVQKGNLEEASDAAEHVDTEVSVREQAVSFILGLY